jgi:inosine/xanthosine triphosphatase
MIVEAKGISNVSSGVNDQPIGVEETKRGAINRAKAALKRCSFKARYSIGLEGGLVSSCSDKNGLDCIAIMAVLDVNTGYISTSSTGTFMLPPPLSSLVRNGMELGDADDIIFQRKNSKQADGTVGILTKGAIDRTEYYVHALILALVPIIQPELYSKNVSLNVNHMAKYDIQTSWWQRYSFQLRENPIFTKSYTSAITTAGGALAGQLLSGKKMIDWRRIFAFGLFGFVGTGPIIHYWTKFLASKEIFKKSTLLKTIVDRLLFHPPFQYLFFIFVALVQGKVSMDVAMQNTNGIIVGVVKKALMFWPPMMYMIFNKLPVEYQAMGSNLTAFVWSSYLGWAS